jgi:hypothetical protein
MQILLTNVHFEYNSILKTQKAIFIHFYISKTKKKIYIHYDIYL